MRERKIENEKTRERGGERDRKRDRERLKPREKERKPERDRPTNKAKRKRQRRTRKTATNQPPQNIDKPLINYCQHVPSQDATRLANTTLDAAHCSRSFRLAKFIILFATKQPPGRQYNLLALGS